VLLPDPPIYICLHPLSRCGLGLSSDLMPSVPNCRYRDPVYRPQVAIEVFLAFSFLAAMPNGRARVQFCLTHLSFLPPASIATQHYPRMQTHHAYSLARQWRQIFPILITRWPKSALSPSILPREQSSSMKSIPSSALHSPRSTAIPSERSTATTSF
jgi:hypothetical protein